MPGKMAKKKTGGKAGLGGGLSAQVIKADGTVVDLGAISKRSLTSRVVTRIRNLFRRSQ